MKPRFYKETELPPISAARPRVIMALIAKDTPKQGSRFLLVPSRHGT
jgi:hypothetical protein